MKDSRAKKLMRQVKKHYNAIAGEFSQTRQKSWYEFEIYKELCFEGAKVLDVGCGNGRLYWQALKERNVKYVGVDVSKGLLKEADAKKKKLKTHKDKLKVKFKEGSLTKIPSKKHEVDILFTIAAFHHLPGRKLREKSLKEMRRVVKPDGYIVISVWNLFQKRYRKYIWQAIWRFMKTFGEYDWNDTLFFWKGKSKGDILRYYHAFTLWEMRALLRDNGLKIIQELHVDDKAIDAPILKAHNFVWICKKI